MRRARPFAAAGLATLALAGCAGPPLDTADDPSTPTAAVPAGPTAIDPDAATAPTGPVTADPAALAAARRFALLARTWSATTLRSQWRRQVALSAGALRGTLRRTAPAAADVARVRDDHAAATATVLGLRLVRADDGHVEVVVGLRERVIAAGEANEQTTANQVDLVRRGRAWRVTAFTLAQNGSQDLGVDDQPG
jgi:hypothetical protein